MKDLSHIFRKVTIKTNLDHFVNQKVINSPKTSKFLD